MRTKVPVEVNISGEQVFAEADKGISQEFEKIVIKPDTKLSDLNEPVVLWAFDDTVEPGKDYRYRMRVGVFNPVAGTDNVSKSDETRKGDVILWSEPSQITNAVDVPGRIYFSHMK